MLPLQTVLPPTPGTTGGARDPSEAPPSPGAGAHLVLTTEKGVLYLDFWLFNLLDHIFCSICFNFRKAEIFRPLRSF